ncbi:MAG: hypothetical protein ABEJ67_02365 [Halanaeroarchaeum sp.]
MRAQTTLDFLVGMSAFLLVVGLVVAMVPGMLAPFQMNQDATPVAGNRVVAALATDELASPERPFVLDEQAVDEVFALGQAGLRTRLHLQSDVSVNVTLANETGTLRTVGPAVPSDRAVTTTWRTVAYRGEHAILTVRLW